VGVKGVCFNCGVEVNGQYAHRHHVVPRRYCKPGYMSERGRGESRTILLCAVCHSYGDLAITCLGDYLVHGPRDDMPGDGNLSAAKHYMSEFREEIQELMQAEFYRLFPESKREYVIVPYKPWRTKR